jgi:hypothetical protein
MQAGSDRTVASGLTSCHFAHFPQQRRTGFASQVLLDLWQSRGKTRAKREAAYCCEKGRIVQDLTH